MSGLRRLRPSAPRKDWTFASLANWLNRPLFTDFRPARRRLADRAPDVHVDAENVLVFSSYAVRYCLKASTWRPGVPLSPLSARRLVAWLPPSPRQCALAAPVLRTRREGCPRAWRRAQAVFSSSG